MSFFDRPSVFLAILFGCVAVLLPRIILPLVRPKPSPTTSYVKNHYHSTPSTILHDEPNKADFSSIVDDMQSTGETPNPSVNIQQQREPFFDEVYSKSSGMVALPMYAIGILIFFIYTCCKYWAKRSTQEKNIRLHYSSRNIQWDDEKREFKYRTNCVDSEIEDDNDDSYAGLDPDYVQYLKARRRKEYEARQSIEAEQKQTNSALDEMKSSLTFLCSKLGKSKQRNELTENEISQLQERLASTEAQMFQILNTINSVSDKVKELAQNSQNLQYQSAKTLHNDDEEDDNLLSRSDNESEESMNDDENSDSDENSSNQEEQNPSNKNQQSSSSSSSSYEEDDVMEGNANDDDDDDEDDELSERYGIMNPNFGPDSDSNGDYELDSLKTPEQTTDSQTKVEEWNQRNQSESLISNDTSPQQAQSLPAETDEDSTNQLSQE